MTLADVLTRARDHAPQIVSARLALEETRARLVGASVRLQNNPELDAAVGTRKGPTERFTDFQFGLAQPDLRALEAGIQEAEAQLRLGTSVARVADVLPPGARLA